LPAVLHTSFLRRKLRVTGGEVKRSRWEWMAMAAFATLVIGVVVRLLLASDPRHNNVYLKVFAPAAQDFVAGRDLYLAPGVNGGFRYPPLCAALFVPFAVCGPVLGSILWRLANVLVLVIGVRAMLRAGLPFVLSSRERALMLGVLTVSAIASVNNGQTNPLVLGLLLLATAATLEARTMSAAGSMSLATTCKIYPFAYGMVLATLRPRLWLGLGLGLLLLAALPYAMQGADYVTAQYRHLYELLVAEDRTGNLGESYRDLQLVAATLHVPLPARWYFALQVFGGFAIVCVAWWRRRCGAAAADVWTFAAAATLLWFLLLGPATEKATYLWIAPPLSWALITAARDGSGPRLCIAGSALLLVIIDNLPLGLPRDVPLLRCLQPFAACLVSLDLVLRAGSPRKEALVLG
jgi:hypothetical protein